jgi:precorrin-6A synthase
MRQISVIGIGAGDPEQVTLQAIAALNRLDVLFVIEKDGDAAELAEFRREVFARHLAPGRACRVVELADPPRDRRAERYADAVEDWRDARARTWEGAIAHELPDGGCGGFLVWGDPSLYDSTIAVLDRIRAGGALQFEREVIPGVSSVHALTARHGIALNRAGGTVQITPGRRLKAGLPADADDVVVMLDRDCVFCELDEPGLEIYWGAYLGTPDELLVAGRVSDVGNEIRRLRHEARQRKGWVMDTYLLRRARPG